MFCAYCRRLFSFQQRVEQYEPVQQQRYNILHEQGSSNADSQLKIEQSGLPVHQVINGHRRDEPEIGVYEDTRTLFTDKVLWFKTLIGEEGLKNGETHDPKGGCLICRMVFSNVSGSFVEGVLRKQSINGGKACEMGFVYQLKRTSGEIGLEPVLSVWLEVGEKLLPMIKLKISSADRKSHHLYLRRYKVVMCRH
jgi:hypothetical protein